MKIRVAKKVLTKAALRQGALSYARTFKALRRVWHSSRYPDGPRAGQRMGDQKLEAIARTLTLPPRGFAGHFPR
jgi:hypothetical protein